MQLNSYLASIYNSLFASSNVEGKMSSPILGLSSQAYVQRRHCHVVNIPFQQCAKQFERHLNRDVEYSCLGMVAEGSELAMHAPKKFAECAGARAPPENRQHADVCVYEPEVNLRSFTLALLLVLWSPSRT